MKKTIMLFALTSFMFGCKKNNSDNPQEPDIKSPKGYSIAGNFPANYKVLNIIGLVVGSNGDVYTCANVSENGIENAYFFKLAYGTEKWQQLGNHKLDGNYCESTEIDGAGNFYYGGSSVNKCSGGIWTKINSPLNYGPNTVGGIPIAVTPSGEIYSCNLNGAPPYNYNYMKYTGIEWIMLGNPQTDPYAFSNYYPRKIKCDNNGNLFVGTHPHKPNHFIYKNNGVNSWERLGSEDYQLLTYAGIEIDKFNNLFCLGYKKTSAKDTLRGDFIAKWNGSNWSEIPYPTGLAQNNNITYNNYIYALASDNNGNIYAAGSLMNSNEKYFIAKWNGVNWTELGAPNSINLNNEIYFLDTDEKGNLYGAGNITDTLGNGFVVRFVP